MYSVGNCSTLVERFQGVRDWRKAKGQRYEKEFLLGLASAAVASGARGRQAITEWIVYHAAEIRAQLDRRSQRVPSGSTIQRMLKGVDLKEIQGVTGQSGQEQQAADPSSGRVMGADGQALYGQALDGKVQCGASGRGEKTADLRLVAHDTGLILGQAAIPASTNEKTMAPKLLAGRDLSGVVVTMDAGHTQSNLAQQILYQGGDYRMVMKKNQPQLYADLDLLFRTPLPRWDDEVRPTWGPATQKAHGRIETRSLVSRTALNDYLDWPRVGQVVQRTGRRVILKTGKVEQEIAYAVTSLTPDRAGLSQLAAFWRGHWTIENRVHYILDDSFGEDRCQVHARQSAHVLSALRSAVLSLLRHRGWHNIAHACRFFAAHPAQALVLVGFPAP